jgi:hypothetical protein
MGKHPHSAITGRFVTNGTVSRHPDTTVRISDGSKAQENRSAISGRFVTNATAARHPNTTIREGK